jgi:phosphate transport system substrate-binding protein
MIKRIILLTLLVMLFIYTPANAAAKTRITISGAWALYPLMTVWADAYQKEHPGVLIDVSAGGAGKGATDVLAGMVDIGMISREAQPDELSKGGYFVPVAKDAVVATVSDKNPVLKELRKKGVKKGMFERIWINNDIKTWGEVVGTTAKQGLHVYTRADSCGAAESWAKYLGKKQENLKGIGVNADPGLLEAIKKDALGIGFNNYSYVYDLKTGKMIPGVAVVYIDVNNNGVVDKEEVLDTREKLQSAIKKGTYPHPPARPLYLMTKGNPMGATKDFIIWILSKGQGMVDSAGYMKIPQETIDKFYSELSGKKKSK